MPANASNKSLQPQKPVMPLFNPAQKLRRSNAILSSLDSLNPVRKFNDRIIVFKAEKKQDACGL